jgi:ribonucleoside-diphosphate reductase alpha chain
MNSKLVITPETKAWVEEWAAKSGRKIPKLKIGQVYWGFQFCNLTEVNASACKTPDELYEAVRAAAFVGTVQAGYQDFPYLGWVTEAITARESLLGVSMTGIMDNPTVALDPEVQKTAAQTAIEENMRVARIIGINPAARVSTVKPSGSASLLLGCSAGIHPHHARRYFRRIRSTPDCSVYQEFRRVNPHWCTKINRTKELITVPVQASHGAMIRKDLTAIQFLKHVLSTKLNWIDAGTARPSSSPGLTHNVSNTVTVKPDEWDAVAEFIWQNRQNFGGVTLLAYVGDKVYENAPFEEVVTEADEARWQHLIKSYKAVDWACFNEEVDGTSLAGEVACAGGACEFST